MMLIVPRPNNGDDRLPAGTPWVQAARRYWLSTPLGEWLAEHWRFRLGAVLWVGALAAATAVGFFDQDDRQVLFLVACIVAWLVVAALLRLTTNSRYVAGQVGGWIARHAWELTLVALGVALGAVAFSGVIRSAGPGGSASALAFLVALAAVWAALVLRVARLAVGVADKLRHVGFWEGLALIAAVGVAALGPILTIVVWKALAAGEKVGDPPLSLSLIIALGPAALAVVGLAVWYTRVATDKGAIEFVFTSDRAGRVGESPGDEPRTKRQLWSGRLGLAATVLTLLSAAMLFAASAEVSFERQTEERSAVAAPGDDTLDYIPRDDQKLLEFYSPVLRLAPDEQWVAADAVEYARRAWREHPDPARPVGCLTPPQFEAGLPIDEKEPCLELYGPSEGYSYEEVASAPGAGDPSPVFGGGGIVYPRIVKVDDAAQCTAGRTCRILDYWIFYPNNVWTSASAIGDITQSHGGDWEHVAVGVDRDRQAVFVGYSAHCTGYKRPWHAVATVGTIGNRAVIAGEAGGRAGAHPLVVVARGSHANYPTTGRRDPDWAGCSPSLDAAAGVVRQVTLQAGAVETTPEFGPIQIPTVATLAVAQRVLAAPWWWGPDERYSLGGLGGGEDESHGPRSPAMQRPGYGRLWDSIRKKWDCDLADEQKCTVVGLGGD